MSKYNQLHPVGWKQTEYQRFEILIAKGHTIGECADILGRTGLECRKAWDYMNRRVRGDDRTR